MKKIITFFSTPILLVQFLFLTLILSNSCQKEIQIDLNETNPAIVIEGMVTSEPGPYKVRVTKSTDFFNPTTPTEINNATVLITDNIGNSDLLTNDGKGNYLTKSLIGVPGNTYTLTVTLDGKKYSGVSFMPALVKLDSLMLAKSQTGVGGFGGGGNGGGGPRPGNSNRLSITSKFTDPANVANYYCFNLFIDSAIKKREGNARFTIQNDVNFDGKVLTRTFRNDTKSGDTVKVELLSIEKTVYDYYRTINSIAGGGGGIGGGNASPANPNTNLSNGAMGYFGAAAKSSKTIYVK